MMPRKTPRAIPVPSYGQGPSHPGRGKWIATVVVLAVAVALLMTLPRYLEKREIREYKIAIKARAALLIRWNGWLQVSSCVRRDDSAHFMPAIEKMLSDPNTDALGDVTSGHPLVDPGCTKALAPLATGPELSDDAKAVLEEWRSASRAFSTTKRQTPEQLQRKLEARDRVLAKVRKTLVPAVHAEIRGIQKLHDKKQDYTWWRLELGFKLDEVFEKAREAHNTGKDVAAVVGPTLKKLEDDRYNADREVGLRPIHGLTVATKATGDAMWTAVNGIDDNGLWSYLIDDNSTLGPMPPEPQGCAVSL